MVAELNPSGFQQKRSNSNFKNVLLLLKDYSSRRLQKELPRKCWNKNGLDDLDDDEQLCNERQPGSRRMAGFRVWFAACRPSRHVRPHRPTPPMPASGDIKVSRIPYFRLMLVSCNMSHNAIISGTSIRSLPMSISAARVMMRIADREIVSNCTELFSPIQ